MDILSGEKLFIEDEQIFDSAHVLTESIKALGGRVVPSRDDATGILVNPGHKSYTPSAAQITYTWPAHCAASGARVDPASLPPPVILNHWRPSYEGLPATVYVSVNLRRMHVGEEPRATKAAVEASLARLGALIVPKRSMADIMVIDRKAAFFTDKITKEVRSAGRDWQRFAEREWVEAVVREGRMLPLQNLEGEIMPGPEEGEQAAPTPPADAASEAQHVQAATPGQSELPSAQPLPPPAQPAPPPPQPAPPQPTDDTDVDMDGEGAAAVEPPPTFIRPLSQKEKDEEARRQREDSFAEEDDDPDAKKAPGRPTGKPRNEYRPEDDDLLCRYLARYHPGGSWSSRKTYQMMEFRVSRHKWVDRHTWQSWLERFKKNAVVFSKRVERYTKASLDDDLKTAAERQAAIERLASSQDKGIANGANEAGPSKGKEKETTLSKSKEKEGTLNKRRLVDSDSDDEPRKKDPPRLALGRNRPGSSFPTQPLRVREPLFLPGPSSQIDGPETIEPVATQPPADGHAEETSVPDAVPLPAEMPTVVPTVVPATEVRSEQPIEPQLESASEQQPEQTMEQLPEQAIVQQPEQPSEQQPEQPSKPQTQTEQVEPQSAQTSELQSGQHPEQPTEQQTESPPEQRAAQPLELELDQPQPPTEQQSMPTEQKESAALSPPQAPTPPSTTHPPPQAPPTASPPAHSSPVVPAPTKAPPAGVLEEPSSPAPPQVTSAQPNASPGAYAPRSSAVADLVERRRMSKRRRTLATVAAPDEKPSLRRIIDTVSVSPGQLRTPPPPPREPGPYVPPAPLTPELLQAKLDAGRNIVASAAQTYRSYINRWLAVYGVGQAEIMAAVEEVRARTDLTRAPLVFGEVERVLEERYGRVEEGA